MGWGPYEIGVKSTFRHVSMRRAVTAMPSDRYEDNLTLRLTIQLRSVSLDLFPGFALHPRINIHTIGRWLLARRWHNCVLGTAQGEDTRGDSFSWSRVQSPDAAARPGAYQASCYDEPELVVSSCDGNVLRKTTLRYKIAMTFGDPDVAVHPCCCPELVSSDAKDEPTTHRLRMNSLPPST
ncbi:hypothetical protein G7Y89_g5254 [Cudoniella acicularis]|uniref:Uncharacterized protein n=1 Tax=Cudoniella acicularis TaxID=354080 RepID=A0A8H4RPW0_9HELO|nr:hypothetical protein G7Y89_g5254 [Cudoniella acicularis]